MGTFRKFYDKVHIFRAKYGSIDLALGRWITTVGQNAPKSLRAHARESFALAKLGWRSHFSECHLARWYLQKVITTQGCQWEQCEALRFYQSLFLRYEIEKGLKAVVWGPEINFSEFFAVSWFSGNWMKARFQTQGLSITFYQLTYNWLAYNFTELRCQQKRQAFTAVLHSLVYWRKRRP